MKKALLFFCLWWMGFSGVKAQELHFFQTGAKWLYKHTVRNESPDIGGVVEYKIVRDTLIDTTWYKMIRIASLSTIVWGPGPNQYNTWYNADSSLLVRYDSLNSRFYAKYITESKEKLAFDFSLQPGDTLQYMDDYVQCYFPAFVSSIDSFLFFGQYLKRFNCQVIMGPPPTKELTINNGFGSLNGFLPSNYCPPPEYQNSYDLICFSFRDSIWGDQASGSCEDLRAPVAVDEIANEAFRVSPNPATTSLSFQTTSFQPQTLSIFDMSGRKVMEEKYSPQIDISALQSGGYFIELRNEETVARKRWVKGN